VELPPAPPGLKKIMIQAVNAETNTGSCFDDEYSALLAEAGFKHEREVQLCGGLRYSGRHLRVYVRAMCSWEERIAAVVLLNEVRK